MQVGNRALTLLAAFALPLACCLTQAWSKPKPKTSAPVRLNVEATVKKVVELSNRYRSEAGLCVLIENPVLDKAASGHSQEMASKDFFDHESPTPERRWPWDRANLLGVDSDAFGENLHLLEGWPPDETAPRVVDAWMRSQHHRENLLSPKFNHVGIGIATVGPQIYVTQLLSFELYPKE